MPIDEKLTSVFVSIRSNLARAVAGIVPQKEIEDIVQETYVRVCQTRSDNEIKSPRSFMFKTARNIALNHVNKAESRLVQSLEDTEDFGESGLVGLSADTYEKVCSDEEFSLFCEAVRRLPEQCRRAFVLKKVYGHTQREIGNILNISEKTVEKHIASGVMRCREYMLHREEAGHIAKPAGSGRKRAVNGVE